MARFVELSHALVDGMKAYPGLPEPKFGCFVNHEQSRARYEGKAEFYIGTYELPGNVGTYIDSPFHRDPGGADLSQLPLDRVAGLPGICVDGDAGPDRSVSISLAADEVRGRAVLVRTGWDARWGTDRYWELGPFLGARALSLLVEAGAALVGVDFWNIDDTQDLARPAHTRLLRAGVPVVEHLCNLAALPRIGFRFTAAPLRIVRGSSFPVRAYAEIL
jgi:kynurenine formamidase